MTQTVVVFIREIKKIVLNRSDLYNMYTTRKIGSQYNAVYINNRAGSDQFIFNSYLLGN